MVTRRQEVRYGLLAVAGAVVVVIGLAFVWVPLALVAGGLVFIAIAGVGLNQ